MPKYTFTFKKNDIFVDFSTTDKEFVEKQFQIWVTTADIYAKSQKKKLSENKPVTPSLKEEKIKPAEIKKEETVESYTFDKASTLLKSINTQPSVNPIPVGSAVNLGWGSDFQPNNASQHSEKEVQSETNVIKEPAKEIIEPKNVPENSAENFEQILEQSIENPTFEPVKSNDEVFLSLVRSKNTTDKFHYLMITAYYLSEFEKMERFTLKQINAKLMHNLSEVIDHATLQEAINQNFIELVPDLTGTSDIGEYRLTPTGEDFFANKI